MTLEEMYKRLQLINPDVTDHLFLSFYNETANEVIERTGALKATGAISVVSGTRKYALPSDVFIVNKVFLDGDRIGPINPNLVNDHVG